MIAPDMATMLSFVATDAPIGASALQAMLTDAVGADLQFHHRRQRYPSTSDTLMLFCHRARPPNAVRRASTMSRTPGWTTSKAALQRLLKSLALQVVRDGEGATQAGRDRSFGRTIR